MSEHELLWEKLLDLVDRNGVLSLRTLKATPGEVAKQLRSRVGDNRVHRFVWGYYYPRVFGKEPGTVTEMEAKAIVESFNHAHGREEHVPLEAKSEVKIETRPQSSCRVCGWRATIAEQV